MTVSVGDDEIECSADRVAVIVPGKQEANERLQIILSRRNVAALTRIDEQRAVVTFNEIHRRAL